MEIPSKFDAKKIEDKWYAFWQKKKFSNETNLPRPKHWSGWNLSPESIEFWLDGDNRIHERLKYFKKSSNGWSKSLLSP